jgi:putative membrane protein
MIRLLRLAVGAYLSLIPTAYAADTGLGNPGFTTPSAPQTAPGMPAPNVVNTDDRLFIREATIGGRAEVQLGELAISKGQNRMVVQFARQMVADHQAANRQLTDLAMRLGIPQPDQLDSDHRDLMAKLEGLTGRTFDLEYIASQIVDHQSTVQLLEWEIGSGENDQLKSFAGDLLPRVMNHLQMARAVQDGLLGRMSDAVVSQAMNTNGR